MFFPVIWDIVCIFKGFWKLTEPDPKEVEKIKAKAEAERVDKKVVQSVEIAKDDREKIDAAKVKVERVRAEKASKDKDEEIVKLRAEQLLYKVK